jgi:hypothetical protein
MFDMLAAVAATFAGKLYAFTSFADGSAYGLTVVVDGETGHYPIRSVQHGERDHIQATADRLNRDELKIPVATVNTIVAQSLRSEGRR